MSEKENEQTLYSGSIVKSVLKNIVPAMVSSLLMLLYNIADTFFIGQTDNDLMVAAVSLATPVFLLFMSFGTLFGVGGASLISRELGMGNRERACHASSFCIWSCVAVGILFMLFLWIFMDPILVVLGASSDTIGYTRSYLNIVTCCGVFSMLVFCCSNLLRAEGKPTAAMAGTLIGNILNIILDPILILGTGWGIRGAAAATVIGNICGAVYYIIYFARGKFSLSVRPKDFMFGDRICRNVLAIGIPASLTSILMSFSQIIANSMIAEYGDMPVAAYGVTGKVRMCFSVIGIGIGQGLQPMLAYCYGHKDTVRFRKSMNFTLLFSLVLFSAATVLCLIFTEPIVKLFLTDESALNYGVEFTRAILTVTWSIGIYDVFLNTLQAMGAAGPSLLASVARQGIVYIPLLFILGRILGLYGLVYAQPIADIASLAMVFILTMVSVKKFTGKISR